MGMLRIGGQVRTEILAVLKQVAPGAKKVRHGGLAIRSHLPEWGQEVLDTGLFNKPIEDMLRTPEGVEKVREIVLKIKKGQITYVGLIGAVYKLNGGAKFVNADADERIKPLMQFASLAALFEIAKPTANLGMKLKAVSTIDEIQVQQRLASAAEQLLGTPGLAQKIADVL